MFKFVLIWLNPSLYFNSYVVLLNVPLYCGVFRLFDGLPRRHRNDMFVNTPREPFPAAHQTLLLLSYFILFVLPHLLCSFSHTKKRRSPASGF